MKLFQSLKTQATGFLDQYKQQSPASYAAAQQAIGGVLILDGLVGIDNPFGQKKRPGILGTITGMIFGIIFMLFPIIGPAVTGTKYMTESTSATVTNVRQETRKDSEGKETVTCYVQASYNVNGKDYKNETNIHTGSHCGLSTGQQIEIKYNPDNPSSWGYDIESFSLVFKIFFFAGIAAFITSLFKFALRLLSIIFGWKLLRSGRKLASSLPEGTNLNTMVGEIKNNFIGQIFSFGRGGAGMLNAQSMNPVNRVMGDNQTPGTNPAQSSIQQVGGPSADNGQIQQEQPQTSQQHPPVSSQMNQTQPSQEVNPSQTNPPAQSSNSASQSSLNSQSQTSQEPPSNIKQQ